MIAGGVTGGTVGVVRAGSAAVRRAQTGFVRYYAAAMLIGMFGMALYFLIFEPHDAVDPDLAAAGGLAAGLAAARPVVPPGRRRRQPGHAGDRDLVPGPLQVGHPGLQFVTDNVWISSLGIHYKLGLDGLNVALVLVTTVLFSAALLWASIREWDRTRGFLLLLRPGRERRAGRVLRPGPGAVRRLLRPDADPVLLPDRDVGHRRSRARHHQAGHLHPGRLVPHAGGRRSPPACWPPASTARR